MSRYFESLRCSDCSVIDAVPGGLFLTRIEHAKYRWHAQKPFYAVVFCVVEPKTFAGHKLAGRIYCTPKAMWKLNWFLRDFGYDSEMLGRGEVSDRALVGLKGVLRVSYRVVKGLCFLNFDAFAPAENWEHLSPLTSDDQSGSEVA